MVSNVFGWNFNHIDAAVAQRTGRWGTTSTHDVCLAAHEAGHAAMALDNGWPVTWLTIKANGDTFGECLFYAPPTDAAEKSLWVTLAGPLAQDMLDGALTRSIIGGGWERDNAKVAEALDAIPDDERLTTLASARTHVRARLKAREQELDRIAFELLCWRSLVGEDLVEIVPVLMTAAVEKFGARMATKPKPGSRPAPVQSPRRASTSPYDTRRIDPTYTRSSSSDDDYPGRYENGEWVARRNGQRLVLVDGAWVAA